MEYGAARAHSTKVTKLILCCIALTVDYGSFVDKHNINMNTEQIVVIDITPQQTSALYSIHTHTHFARLHEEA